MLRPCCHITIGKLEFTYVHSVETFESWERSTDTAQIQLPRRLVIKEGTVIKEELDTNVAPLFKRGDDVVIKLGYESPVEVFRGFVTRVGTEAPIVIECEDQMWKLKQQAYTKSWENFKIDTLIQDLMARTGIPYKVTLGTPYGMGKLRVKGRPNKAQVLELLREQYNIQSFFRNGTLYVGEAYVPELREKHDIRFDRHVVESDLEYRNKEDHRVKVTVKTKRGSKSYEAVARGSDEDGDQVNVTRYDLDPANLQAEADRLLPLYKYEGYEGTFTLFGTPMVRHGDELKLFDPQASDNRGSYLVRSVRRIFGMSGYRQAIELDQRV
jgi:hypothetical protein